MTAASPQAVQIACPNCRTPLRVPLVTLIDVRLQPELKGYLLSGQLNMVICPNCGFTSMLASPLIYHDPDKQLFFVHFPQQLNASPEEQQRFVGEATSALMRSLPPDAPRAYLLSPRNFLTLNSLVEAVLEADGITKEMMAAQRARVELLGQLAEAFEQGEEPFAQLAEEHRDQLDVEFFATLNAYVAASEQAAQDESSQLLTQLRDKLVELVGDPTEGGEIDPSVAEAVEQLIAAKDDELESLIADLRPVIDYEFFEVWTQQIDAAVQAGDLAKAEQLTARRALILETIERLDQEAQAMAENALNLLREALNAEDPREVLQANVGQINDAFLLMLDANAAAAERAGVSEAVAKLAQIRELAQEVVNESLSPEDRLINELVALTAADEIRAKLRANIGLVTSAFVKRLNELADEAAKSGQQEASEQYRVVSRIAGAMLF